MRKTAQTGLAVILALGLGLPCFAQSETLPLPFPIDRASREISVVVDKGLKSTNRLPTRALREARLALLDKQPVEADMLKALADRGETLAALRYVDVLMARGIEENASDVAYYGAIAVGGGRVWALPEMVEALQYLDPATEPKARINKYIQVLYAHAWAGNELALDAVIDYNGEGRLFGPLSAATKAKIDEQINTLGGGRSDLKMAISILRKDTLTNQDLADARSYLDRAQQAENLAVATTAANLIEQLAAGKYTSAAATN
ncbi:hypothetical protein VK792_05995 [Mesobacterium sp. TK19101]|uniref:Uncharacterized protein n=1 Tax=Mesobacterium hydrothermale TaxID=3111907 RepID=A0ABU6HGE9_9RHOB|nr:hypothetical protein [Mesobacterium sp. TK19101]MEC3860829.1 hypothetical protein [Mesobacterium sp. TK19101]